MPGTQNQLALEWRSFVAALGLMSRIPAKWLSRNRLELEHHQRAQIWYPAVGLVLGCLLAFIIFLLPSNWAAFLSAVILVVLWVGFTGALHIDGLADTADAWVGGMGDRQRTLDIMKDPSCGPSGVTTIVLCLLMKCALIASIIQSALWPALILVPMIARSWLLPMLGSMPYARLNSDGDQSPAAKAGMANTIAYSFPRAAGTLSFLVSQILSAMVLIWLANGLLILLTANLVSATLFFVIKRSATRRLGGYTGDFLGASIELQELALLASIALFISI